MKTQIPCCYALLVPDSLWSWNTCRELQHFDRHLYICGKNHWWCCFSRKDKDTFFGIRGRHLFLDSGSGLVLSTATLRPSFRARSQAETHCCQEPSMSWSSCAQTVKTNHYTHLRCFPPKLLNQIHLISCSWRSSSCVWVLSCGRYLNSLCSHTRSPLEWYVSGRTLICPLQNSKEGYVIKKLVTWKD